MENYKTNFSEIYENKINLNHLNNDSISKSTKDDIHITKEFFNSHSYVIIHKPFGIVSSRDESEGKTIYNLISEVGISSENLGLVGRLDKNTTGLMLLTSDARLNRALTYPCDESEIDENLFKEKEYLIIWTD